MTEQVIGVVEEIRAFGLDLEPEPAFYMESRQVPGGRGFLRAQKIATVLVVSELYGFPLPWEPEKWLEAIMLHPAADHTFRYSVEAVVDAFAPNLKGRIRRSGMAARPSIA